jgi:hypothetical protein
MQQPDAMCLSADGWLLYGLYPKSQVAAVETGILLPQKKKIL